MSRVRGFLLSDRAWLLGIGVILAGLVISLVPVYVEYK